MGPFWLRAIRTGRCRRSAAKDCQVRQARDIEKCHAGAKGHRLLQEIAVSAHQTVARLRRWLCEAFAVALRNASFAESVARAGAWARVRGGYDAALMPRFAANISLLFTHLPFLERFDAAAQAGFAGVEFLFPYEFAAREIAARLQASGVQAVLHNLPPGDWWAGERGIACLPERRDEFRASVQRGVEYALALGVPQLHCLSGIAPQGVSPERVFSVLVDNMRYAAEQCAAAGLTLLVEPINTFDFPGYALSRTSQAVALIEAVGAKNLKLQFDIYHAQRMQGELAATLAQHLPLIAHVQIADNPGRHEPGSGEIHFPFLLALLDRLGYAGWVGCEYRPAGDTVAGLGWLHAVRAATPHAQAAAAPPST